MKYFMESLLLYFKVTILNSKVAYQFSSVSDISTQNIIRFIHFVSCLGYIAENRIYVFGQLSAELVFSDLDVGLVLLSTI